MTRGVMALCVKTSLMPLITTICYSHLKPSVGTSSDPVSMKVLHLNSVCTLLFTRFNVCSFCGSAAISKRFIHKNVNINGYVQYNCQQPQI